MPIRTGVLARAILSGTQGQVIGTVPVSDTWIVKDIEVYNGTGASITANIQFQTSSSGIFGFFASITVPAGGRGNFAGFVVGAPGDQLAVYAVVTSPVHVWVSGVDLPGHL